MHCQQLGMSYSLQSYEYEGESHSTAMHWQKSNLGPFILQYKAEFSLQSPN